MCMPLAQRCKHLKYATRCLLHTSQREAADRKKVAALKRKHREAVKAAKELGQPIPEEPNEIRAVERKAANRESSREPSTERLRREPFTENMRRQSIADETENPARSGISSERVRRGDSSTKRERNRPSERVNSQQPPENLLRAASIECEGSRVGAIRSSSRTAASKLSRKDPARQGVRWEDEEVAAEMDTVRTQLPMMLNKMLPEQEDMLTKDKVFAALKKLAALKRLGRMREEEDTKDDENAVYNRNEEPGQYLAMMETSAIRRSSTGAGVADFLTRRVAPSPAAEGEEAAMPALTPENSNPHVVGDDMPLLLGGADYGHPSGATATPMRAAAAPKSPVSLALTPVSREHLPQPDALTKAYMLIGGGENGKPSRLNVLDACCDCKHALRGLIGLPAQVHPADRSDFESVFQAMGKIETSGFISEADFDLFADSAIEFCRLRTGAVVPAASSCSGPSSTAAKTPSLLVSWREGRPEEGTRSAPSVKPLFPGTKVGPAFVLKRDAAATLAEQCAAAVLEKKEREGKAGGAVGRRTAKELKVEEENERRRREAEKARVEAFEAFERERIEAARQRQVERKQAVAAATLGVTEGRRLAREAQEAIRRRENEARETIRRRQHEERERKERVAAELKMLAVEAERDALWEAEAAKQTATAFAAAERAKREAEEELAAAEMAKKRLAHARTKREVEERDAEDAEAAVAAGVMWMPSRPDSPWNEEATPVVESPVAKVLEDGGESDAAVAETRTSDQQMDADSRLRSFISSLGTKGGASLDEQHGHADRFIATAAHDHAPSVVQRLHSAAPSLVSSSAMRSPGAMKKLPAAAPVRENTQCQFEVIAARRSLMPAGAHEASSGRCVPSDRSSEGCDSTPNRAIASLVRQKLGTRSLEQNAQGLYETPLETPPGSESRKYSSPDSGSGTHYNDNSMPPPLIPMPLPQMRPSNCVRCSLIFSEANGGCFLEQWSSRLVEGALAAFVPQRPVPEFRLRNNGGRNEILRNVGGPNAKRFFMGWTRFVKIARGAEGIFCHLANLKQLPVAIYVHDEQMRVARLPLGVSTDMRSVKAVAATPALAPDLRVSRLESSLFHHVGGRIGASLVLQEDVELPLRRSTSLRPCSLTPLPSRPGITQPSSHTCRSSRSTRSPVQNPCGNTLLNSNSERLRIARFDAPCVASAAMHHNGIAPKPASLHSSAGPAGLSHSSAGPHSSAGAAAQTLASTSSPLACWLRSAPCLTASQYTTSLHARSERNESLMISSPPHIVWHCYLLFSEANGGCFVEQWSSRFIEGALAAFVPLQVVPSFKLRSNGGRSEILRDAGGPNIKRFFVGWTHFVKSARATTLTRTPLHPPLSPPSLPSDHSFSSHCHPSLHSCPTSIRPFPPPSLPHREGTLIQCVSVIRSLSTYR